jgi:hypothetical protein
MATAVCKSRGNTVVTTTGATWASTANAYDGAMGTNPATFTTWTSAVSGDTGSITIGGYTFPGCNANSATISSCTALIRHKEVAAANITSVTVQLQDSTGVNIGSAVSGTTSGSIHGDTLTLGTPTLAQVAAGLQILVTITHAANTTSAVFSLDQVDVTVNAQNPSISTLIDSFDTQDTTKWTGWQTGVAVVNGMVQINPPAGSLYYLDSAQPYDLTGANVFAKITGYNNKGTNNSIGMLVLSCSGVGGGQAPPHGGNYYEQVQIFNGPSYSRTWPAIFATETVNGTSAAATAGTGWTNPFDLYASDAVWFRLREAGGIIYWGVSPDAVNWTTATSGEFASHTNGGVDITQVYLRFFAQSDTAATLICNFDSVNVAPPTPAKIATLIENFNNPTVAPNQWVCEPDPAAAGSGVWSNWAETPGVIFANGQATVSAALNGTALSETDLSAQAAFDLTGSSISLHVSGISTTNGGQNVVIQVLDNVNQSYYATMGMYNAGAQKGTPIFQAGLADAATTSGPTTPPAWNASTYAWWRIREASGTIYFDYSSDGAVWINLWSAAYTSGIYTSCLVYILEVYQDGSATSAATANCSNLSWPTPTKLTQSQFFAAA